MTGHTRSVARGWDLAGLLSHHLRRLTLFKLKLYMVYTIMSEHRNKCSYCVRSALGFVNRLMSVAHSALLHVASTVAILVF